MHDVLAGLCVVEAASFIAAPSCGLHLAQLGAEVIRIDPIGGGPDYRRWPLTPEGASLYWEGLNKGKKSIAVDFARPEGRELVQRLAAAAGEDRGLFVTNFPPDGFLSHEKLAALRHDIITLRIMGWSDGAQAVDYTVNAAMGIPLMTGPASLGDAPVNSVLPTWDLLAGAYGAFALLAAARARRMSGKGAEIRLPLGDLAAATLGHLGQLAEVLISGADRPRIGNDLFGAFGRDFASKDGHRVMVVAITARQWSALLAALGVGGAVAALEGELGLSFASDEGLRYQHRQRLWPIFEPAFAARSIAELAALFDESGVTWAPYRTVAEAATSRDRFGFAAAAMDTIVHPSGYTYPAAGAAARFESLGRAPVTAAPMLGQHTDEVLSSILALPDGEIARLRDQGLVG
jgi:2-methylfumaryl-CoA isomerase